MASQPLTEYERKRLENIKRNDEMMASLKLHSKAVELSSSATKRQRTDTKTYRTTPEKKPKSETPTVIRRSLRTQGLPPDPSSAKGLEDDIISFPVRSPHTSPVKSEIRQSGPLTMQEVYKGKVSDRLLIDTVSNMSDNAPLNCLSKKKKMGSLNLGSMVLKPENVARVMPSRIMNVKFFPCNDRTMVVAGNKYGNMVFWDVECDNSENVGIYLYQPHTAPISGISIHPFSLSKVLSSDDDGYVRSLDFGKESFDLVYSSESSIYSLSQRPQDSNSIYLSEGRGMLNLWDSRAGKSSKSWGLHDSRINTIDFNPENTNLMATSSSDGSACIWDLRQMDAGRPKNLKIVDHKKAVHSAYFSPSGSCLATTSMDNKIGILSGVDFGDKSMVFHNNHTGRWISSFRGIWGWDDEYIFIGSMEREVDVLSRSGKVTSLRSSEMTAIPCRFATHPSKVGMLAGATSGGQIYIWTQN